MNAPPWPPHHAPPFPNLHNENVAADHSHVDQQIGAHYGDTTFHRYEIYNLSANDPPERKYEVARNHLKGGTPRFAEEIFADLVRGGLRTTGLAYHYTLSVLSGRSFNELDSDLYQALDGAWGMAQQLPRDEWWGALAVVRQLMSAVWQQEVDGNQGAESLQKVFENFRMLMPARQAEISRHLDMILTGALQDHLDDVDARRIAIDRMEPDRAGRAWKFFEPDPARPRLLVPYATPVDPATWLKVLAGGVVAVLALLWAVAGIDGAGTAIAAIGMLTMLGGGWLVVVAGSDRRLVAMLRERADFEHGMPHYPANPNSPGHWVSTKFVKELHRRVDARFRDARPHRAGNWEADTRGIRERLKDRLVTLYGNAQVTPESVDWLIRWHAARVGARWRDGTLYDYRAGLVPSSATVLRFWLGVVVAVLGLVGLTGAGVAVQALVVAVAGGFGLSGLIDIIATRRFDRAVASDNESRAEEELRGFHEWVAVLADRPTDVQMGEWLDLDTSFLKTAALRRCGLKNRDLVAHVVLTEGAADARRARVLQGPVRYSRYTVMVFLLTRSGVRQIAVDLDFLQGHVHDERRVSFRYDTLASARVSEVGVRFANDRRYVVDVTRSDPFPGGDVVVRSRAFNLSLLDGQDITVVVENFDGLADAQEDPSRLLRMALDSSGISGALHILEAVAAEGRDWIDREHERRKRRSEEWLAKQSPQRLAAPNLRMLFGGGDHGTESHSSPA